MQNAPEVFLGHHRHGRAEHELGTYHKMLPKHLQRYFNESRGRQNVRVAAMLDQMKLTRVMMGGNRLRYTDLKNANDLESREGVMAA